MEDKLPVHGLGHTPTSGQYSDQPALGWARNGVEREDQVEAKPPSNHSIQISQFFLMVLAILGGVRGRFR